MEKKYLIFPGYVTSSNDGERHHISAYRLIKLYRVNPAECVIYDGRQDKTRGTRREEESNLIQLYPRSSGVYEVPQQQEERTKNCEYCRHCMTIVKLIAAAPDLKEACEIAKEFLAAIKRGDEMDINSEAAIVFNSIVYALNKVSAPGSKNSRERKGT